MKQLLSVSEPWTPIQIALLDVVTASPANARRCDVVAASSIIRERRNSNGCIVAGRGVGAKRIEAGRGVEAASGIVKEGNLTRLSTPKKILGTPANVSRLADEWRIA
jgi:hypothetical protein